MNQTYRRRKVVAFAIGGLVASAAAAFVWLAVTPAPPPSPATRRHPNEAFGMLVLVMFFCGGFISRSGVRAGGFSNFLPSIIGSFVVVVALYLTVGLSFAEIAPIAGFASAGIASSALVSLLMQRWFRPKTPNYEA